MSNLVSKNYTLGRGRLYFALFKPNTRVPMGERYLGNSPEVSFTSESQKLEHFDSDKGVRLKDASVLLQMDYSGKFSLDDIQYENLAMLFLGEMKTTTATAQTIAAESHLAVQKGYSYQLGQSTTNPVGNRNVKSVVVKDDKSTPTTYVAGTDYVVDDVLGRITILVGGTIANGTNLLIAYSTDPYTLDGMISKGESVKGQLRFIADNPTGANIDYLLPYVEISPDGDYQLKGDSWQTMNFTMSILKNGDLEAVYANGRPYSAAP